jgi:hypothetical protein
LYLHEGEIVVAFCARTYLWTHILNILIL